MNAVLQWIDHHYLWPGIVLLVLNLLLWATSCFAPSIDALEGVDEDDSDNYPWFT